MYARGDDHHRAGHGERLGDRKEERERFGAALLGAGLGLVQRVELLDLAFLGVRGAHDADARERLPEHARHAVVEIGQLEADGLEAAVDERQRAAERDRQKDDERRERPGEEEERGDVEERDARPLDERQHRVDGDGRPVGLDEKDVGEIAARQAIEEIEVGAVEPPEEVVAEPDGDAPLEARRQHERGVEGGVLERHRQHDGDAQSSRCRRRANGRATSARATAAAASAWPGRRRGAGSAAARGARRRTPRRASRRGRSPARPRAGTAA